MQHTKKRNGMKSHMLLLPIFLVAVVVLIFTVQTASAGHRHPRACSKTASAAFLACRNEAKDDYWIAKGNCYNMSDKEDQSECFSEAAEEYQDAKELCGDQLEARKEVCEELGEAPYEPEIDPANFVDDPTTITSSTANPYFPLVPGYQWVYEGGDETITVTVTTETVEILGVTCIEVTDVVEVDGEVIEDTTDWYAQDTDGNVWYMGERSLAREDCEEDNCDAYLLSDDGSWIAGVDGALPGIIMYASPDPDNADQQNPYRQEFLLGDAEDVGEVKELGGQVNVLGTDYPSHVVTEDTTPLEPDVSEDKFYAEGLGLYKEVPNEGDPVELVSFTILP